MTIFRGFFLGLFFFLSTTLFSKTVYPLTRDPIDVVIPCASKDKRGLELCIQGVKDYVKGVRRVIIVSNEKLTDLAEWFPEQAYPFSKKDLVLEIFNQDSVAAVAFIKQPASRAGWIYQQLLKLYASFVIPDISSNLLIVDADVIFLNDVEFLTKRGEPLFAVGTERHKPYFEHMARLIRGLKRVYRNHSGVVHHMLFQRPILEDLFHKISVRHHMEPWRAIARCIDHKELYKSCFSEYETYFNFVFRSTDQAQIRPLKWGNFPFNPNFLEQYKAEGYAYVAFQHYL